MDKTKIYAVKQGRKVGLFYSWSECEHQIHGFSGAQYKSFTDINDANEYLGLESILVESRPVETSLNEMVAYIDGSYNESTKEYSAGGVIFYKGEKETYSQKFNDPSMVDMRNVAGEIMGAVLAIEHAMKQGAPCIKIYYDYVGIEKWCTGEWQSKTEGTKRYRDFYLTASKQLDIRFIKVKAHSGIQYNEEADRLAKAAFTQSSEEPPVVPFIKTEVTTSPKFNATVFIQYEQGPISDKDLINHFKIVWKTMGRKLNEIKKAEIFSDVIKSGYHWKVSTTQGIEEGFTKISD